jgi:hypothetical protein
VATDINGSFCSACCFEAGIVVCGEGARVTVERYLESSSGLSTMLQSGYPLAGPYSKTGAGMVFTGGETCGHPFAMMNRLPPSWQMVTLQSSALFMSGIVCFCVGKIGSCMVTAGANRVGLGTTARFLAALMGICWWTSLTAGEVDMRPLLDADKVMAVSSLAQVGSISLRDGADVISLVSLSCSFDMCVDAIVDVVDAAHLRGPCGDCPKV